MSGHSKWANIKNRKQSEDAKKAKVFTKIARTITVAARGGADTASNFQLRLAISQARAANMPRENVDRAIARATGEGKEQLEEVLYEAYGPFGIAILIQALTDNRNRTVSNLKHIFSNYGGSLAGAGSVKYLFDRKGVARVASLGSDREATELKLIDGGAEDIAEEDGLFVIYSAPDKLKNILAALGDLAVEYSGLEWIAKERIAVSDPAVKQKLEELYNSLDEDDDVNEWYSNEA
ncbi:MAG: YebC/PmpR family DNA-binding transcriptional regulator [Patescibacteria group bacterium]|nr:YebC/PmpR family DNA-binding transcriptional regulator [Patescibacteria group bacterium]